MKRILLIVSAILLLNISVYANSFSEAVTVYYNDTDVYSESEYNPIIMNDRTLVPLRPIFEMMGLESEAIVYDDNIKTASFEIDYVVTFTNESDSAKISYEDGQTDEYYLDVPATIYNGHFYIPIRAFCEIWGTDIEWDDETRSVYISDENDEEFVDEDDEEFIDEENIEE